MKTCNVLVLILCLSPALAQSQTNTTNSTAPAPAPVSSPAPSSQNSCNSDQDCSFHGKCNTATRQCVCDSGYITPTNGGAACSYEQKKQLNAFLLHLIVLGWFGAGEFYVGNMGLGAGQLVLGTTTIAVGCVGCCTAGVCAACGNGCGAGTAAIAAAVIAGCTGLANLAWWIADCVRFGTNEAKDGNGQTLKPW